jgi:hypothetical protein
MEKYIVRFWIPIDIQWDVWDEEVYQYWTLEEVLEKIIRRQKKYKDPYSVYKIITDIQKKEEYEEMKSAIEQRPQDVTVTLKVDTAKLDQKELDTLVSFLRKGARIKVVMDGAKINDLQSLLSLAKKADISIKINITDDVYNLLQTSQP